jgi:hypothetical protein
MVPNLITEIFSVWGFQLVDATQRCPKLMASPHDVLLMTLFQAQSFNSWLVVVVKSFSKIVSRESARVVKVWQWLVSPHLMFLLQTDKIFRGSGINTVSLSVSCLQQFVHSVSPDVFLSVPGHPILKRHLLNTHIFATLNFNLLILLNELNDL